MPKAVNWLLNLMILALIVASYVANREGAFTWERQFAGILIVLMALTVFYGVLKLGRMQAAYDAGLPPKAAK